MFVGKHYGSGLLIVFGMGAVKLDHHRNAPAEAPLPHVYFVSRPAIDPDWDLRVDQAERYLVLESYRKLEKWKLPRLSLNKTIRWQNRVPAKSFHLISIAYSPDRHSVAIGGYTGEPDSGNVAVYILDHKSGKLRLVTRLGVLPYSLAYSPDGMHLAIGSPYGSGFVLTIDLSSGKTASPSNALLGEITSLNYAPDDRLAICASSRRVAYNRIAVFNKEGTQIASTNPPIGDIPNEIRFSPDGKELVVASRDKPVVVILDSKTLAEKASLNFSDLKVPPPMNATPERVAWSTDGNSVYAAGNGRNSSGKTVIRRWDRTPTGWSAPQDVPVATTAIRSIVPLPKGDGVAFTTMGGFGYFSDL